MVAGVTEVVCGKDHIVVLKEGAVYSWGSNQQGQLGTGDTTSSSTPQQVHPLHSAHNRATDQVTQLVTE